MRETHNSHGQARAASCALGQGASQGLAQRASAASLALTGWPARYNRPGLAVGARAVLRFLHKRSILLVGERATMRASLSLASWRCALFAKLWLYARGFILGMINGMAPTRWQRIGADGTGRG